MGIVNTGAVSTLWPGRPHLAAARKTSLFQRHEVIPLLPAGAYRSILNKSAAVLSPRAFCCFVVTAVGVDRTSLYAPWKHWKDLHTWIRYVKISA